MQDISSVFDQDPIAAETLLMVVNLPARTVVSIKLVDGCIFRIVGGVDKHRLFFEVALLEIDEGV